MTATVRIATCLLAISLTSACGGGGGGDGDTPQEETLLLAVPITRNGSTTPGGDEYTILLRFGPNETELPLAVIDTDADGTFFVADAQDPAFPLLIQALRNGQPDTLKLRTALGVGAGTITTDDTNPFNLESDDLAGPDLIGAGITRIGVQVDSVDIESAGATTTHNLTAAFQIFGFPRPSDDS